MHRPDCLTYVFCWCFIVVVVVVAAVLFCLFLGWGHFILYIYTLRQIFCLYLLTVLKLSEQFYSFKCLLCIHVYFFRNRHSFMVNVSSDIGCTCNIV